MASEFLNSKVKKYQYFHKNWFLTYIYPVEYILPSLLTMLNASAGIEATFPPFMKFDLESVRKRKVE